MKRLICWAPTCAVMCVFWASTAHAGDDNYYVPSCPEGTLELKIDYPTTKEYSVPGTSEKVKVVTDGYYFDWESTVGMDAVIAEAGYYAKDYPYAPEAYSGTKLHAPIDPKTYKPRKLSRIKFCYDLNLKVEKTAVPAFKRKFEWSIDKTASPYYLEIKKGETAKVWYEVTLDAEPTDFDKRVSGEITITNPTKFEAKIDEVKDMLGDSPVYPTCKDQAYPNHPIAFPYKLAAYGVIKCTYEATVAADTAYVENKVVVKTNKYSKVGGDSATAVAKFENPTKKIDECVKVTDTLEYYDPRDLGTVCAYETAEPIKYYHEFKYLDCGEHEFKNVAEFTTKDTYTTGYDSAVVKIKVICLDGCTHSQGYWKTHSKCGPNSQDPVWEQVGPQGSFSLFYKSYQKWCEVLWTSPAGNAWYILAHQFIAAKLNVLAYADPEKIKDILDKAEWFFDKCGGPSDWQYKCPNVTKNDLTYWAGILDAFNNGYKGPQKCE